MPKWIQKVIDRFVHSNLTIHVKIKQIINYYVLNNPR